MSGNRVLTAIVVLVGLLALTVWQWNKRDAEVEKPPEVVAKLPELKKDDVDVLIVSPPGKTAVTLKKSDGTWKLTAPIETDADKDAVDTALSKLEELTPVAVAATLAENHEKLEVTEDKGIHVTAKQGDKVLADVFIGAYLSGNTMVREEGQVQVTSAKGSMKYAFDKELKEWRDRVIVETAAEQVKSATFTNESGTFKFVKEGSDWKQAPGEKTITNFDGSKVSSIVGTLTSLRANDFAADDVTAEAAGLGETPTGSVTLELSGDAGDNQIVVRIGSKQDSGYYAMREGKKPIYIISTYAGERLLPTADKFAKEEPKAANQPPGKTVVVEPKKVVAGPVKTNDGHGH